MNLIGYDFDGVVSTGIDLVGPCVIISGRTFAEYDNSLKLVATHIPVYIRGAGEYGDHKAAGEFKAMMIKHLGVTEFHEDHPLQIEIIRRNCPACKIVEYPHA